MQTSFFNALLHRALYKKTTLQFLACQLAQGTAFPFYEVYVGEEVFAVQFFAQVGEAIGPGVKVRLVYLEDISSKDNLSSLAGTGNYGLYLMRGEVLGFVDDEEGIYVGYRYFDTFEVPTRYCFGYGLSYTDFEIHAEQIKVHKTEAVNPEISVTVRVTNIGKTYAGKEVVQLYVSCPQGDLHKEYRRLVAYEKTKLLQPGETTILDIRFSLDSLASFDKSESGWILSEGSYGIYVGNSLNSSKVEAVVDVEESRMLTRTEHICPLQEELKELLADTKRLEERRSEWLLKKEALLKVQISSDDIQEVDVVYGVESEEIEEDIKQFVDTLSIDELNRPFWNNKNSKRCGCNKSASSENRR